MIHISRRLHRSSRWLCALLAGGTLAIGTAGALAQARERSAPERSRSLRGSACSRARRPVGSEALEDRIGGSEQNGRFEQAVAPAQEAAEIRDRRRETITGRR